MMRRKAWLFIRFILLKRTESKNNTMERRFILLQDLPTIKKGRVIKLSDNGQIGSPILMDVEKDYCVLYYFPINILEENKEWFQEFEQSQNINIEFESD